MNLRQYFESTTREVLIVCPVCSTTRELEAPIDSAAMRKIGFELVDDAWTARCEGCETKHVAASNAEYESLARAAAQIGKIDKAGPLAHIEIPTGEGFEHEGELLFGFWAVSGHFTDDSFERFRRTAWLIVEQLNEDRGTRLLVNVNADGTQAIVHGIVD